MPMPWEFVCGQTLASALSFGAADDAAKMGAEKADSKPGLRHVERVVRTYGRECGYDTPVQEVEGLNKALDVRVRNKVVPESAKVK